MCCSRSTKSNVISVWGRSTKTADEFGTLFRTFFNLFKQITGCSFMYRRKIVILKYIATFCLFRKNVYFNNVWFIYLQPYVQQIQRLNYHLKIKTLFSFYISWKLMVHFEFRACLSRSMKNFYGWLRIILIISFFKRLCCNVLGG